MEGVTKEIIHTKSYTDRKEERDKQGDIERRDCGSRELR